MLYLHHITKFVQEKINASEFSCPLKPKMYQTIKIAYAIDAIKRQASNIQVHQLNSRPSSSFDILMTFIWLSHGEPNYITNTSH